MALFQLGRAKEREEGCNPIDDLLRQQGFAGIEDYQNHLAEVQKEINDYTEIIRKLPVDDKLCTLYRVIQKKIDEGLSESAIQNDEWINLLASLVAEDVEKAYAQRLIQDPDITVEQCVMEFCYYLGDDVLSQLENEQEKGRVINVLSMMAIYRNFGRRVEIAG